MQIVEMQIVDMKGELACELPRSDAERRLIVYRTVWSRKY
jgi:hypothetical protein